MKKRHKIVRELLVDSFIKALPPDDTDYHPPKEIRKLKVIKALSVDDNYNDHKTLYDNLRFWRYVLELTLNKI